MDVMQGVKVEEVMRTRFVSINKDRSVAELMALFQETNLLGFPVVTVKTVCGVSLPCRTYIVHRRLTPLIPGK
jgi:predicted transcriptional regulator